MNKKVKTLLFVIIACVLVAAGIVIPGLFLMAEEDNETSSYETCDAISRQEVCVTIKNQSGQDTKKLILIHGKMLKKEIGILKNGTQTSFQYESTGEDSYTLLAILNNGDTLKSKEAYTEGGWKMTEVISKDSITTIYNKQLY